jgi:nucleotide-binding universal stress UspA family protein
MYNTILVPLDGSKRAEAILPHVQDLAQRYGAVVILLRVVGEVPSTGSLDYVDIEVFRQELDRRTEAARAYLTSVQQRLAREGIDARIVVNDGPVVDAIIRTAEDEGADLIAIASHGRTGLRRVFYGSVAAGVLHRVDRPLLLVRSDGDG